MQKVVVDGGGIYIDFDANLSNTQQLTDVQTLINQGLTSSSCSPRTTSGAEVVKLATQTTSGYDRLIEDKERPLPVLQQHASASRSADAMFRKAAEGQLRP